MDPNGENTRACSLYRFYGEGELLYVGITGVGSHRFSGHRREKEWWHRVAYIEVEHYPTRRAALMAEAMQIKGLNPIFNIAHAVDAVTPHAGGEHYRCSRCRQTFVGKAPSILLCPRCKRMTRQRSERIHEGRRLEAK